ncbi:hypothetical protein VTK73DRAFT_3938 [Phialemonium thermophilum]|uniref:BZIP transcription factor n=1 Tax=Phialemonium thermophilum TaxID=223376 RepID=A0ABR3Y0H6_9PEZI
MMTRSPSTDAPKVIKRKGTRSVSTLTPSQLARKRANDREAQRAIRARTKEHIERLERELEELKNQRSCDETVRVLLKKNQELEEELRNLRESIRLQPTSASYPPTPYDEGLPISGSRVSSRTPSFGHGQGSADYRAVSSLGTPYMPTPEQCDRWPPILPSTVSSVVSSPTSSIGQPEDYMGCYIPTSVPTRMVDNTGMTRRDRPYLENLKAEYDDLHSGTQPHEPTTSPSHCIDEPFPDGGFSQHLVPRTSTPFLPQHGWPPVYAVYYH